MDVRVPLILDRVLDDAWLLLQTSVIGSFSLLILSGGTKNIDLTEFTCTPSQIPINSLLS